MTVKTTILPPKTLLEKRLNDVNDDAHLNERFYPLILKRAGTSINAYGVVNILMLSIYDYVEGLPSIISTLMHDSIGDYIEAMVGHDDEVKKDALDLIEKSKKQ